MNKRVTNKKEYFIPNLEVQTFTYDDIIYGAGACSYCPDDGIPTSDVNELL